MAKPIFLKQMSHWFSQEMKLPSRPSDLSNTFLSLDSAAWSLTSYYSVAHIPNLTAAPPNLSLRPNLSHIVLSTFVSLYTPCCATLSSSPIFARSLPVPAIKQEDYSLHRKFCFNFYATFSPVLLYFISCTPPHILCKGKCGQSCTFFIFYSKHHSYTLSNLPTWTEHWYCFMSLF